jgi:hypothetical protein
VEWKTAGKEQHSEASTQRPREKQKAPQILRGFSVLLVKLVLQSVRFISKQALYRKASDLLALTF